MRKFLNKVIELNDETFEIELTEDEVEALESGRGLSKVPETIKSLIGSILEKKFKKSGN